MGERTVRVGILGFGTVGTGVYRMLQDNAEAIARKMGFPVEVVRIGVRDLQKPRGVDAALFTGDLESIVDDPTIDVVLELMGGTDPAGPLVERALRNGKHVVTANKELMAKEGGRLVQMAKERGLDLHYEAAVGGGIPLVQPMKHQLAGNEVLRMMGILNGTTNYILTKMHAEGAEFADALAEAQAKGYAEADPTNDVDGFDTSYKIAILASIACGKQVPVSGVYREGIRSVTKKDMHYADVLGYRLKLLGIMEPAEGGAVQVRVHPTLLPKAHPLASVEDVYNAVWIHGDFVGDVMFSGRGAGSEPTASAVVGDLIDVGRNIYVGGRGSAIPWVGEATAAPIEACRTAYYLRLVVDDRPKVLGAIAALFGEYDVSLSAMEMRTLGPGEGEIVFLTHTCLEADYRRALVALETLPSVRSVAATMRVEED